MLKLGQEQLCFWWERWRHYLVQLLKMLYVYNCSPLLSRFLGAAFSLTAGRELSSGFCAGRLDLPRGKVLFFRFPLEGSIPPVLIFSFCNQWQHNFWFTSVCTTQYSGWENLPLYDSAKIKTWDVTYHKELTESRKMITDTNDETPPQLKTKENNIKIMLTKALLNSERV